MAGKCTPAVSPGPPRSKALHTATRPGECNTMFPKFRWVRGLRSNRGEVRGAKVILISDAAASRRPDRAPIIAWKSPGPAPCSRPSWRPSRCSGSPVTPPSSRAPMSTSPETSPNPSPSNKAQPALTGLSQTRDARAKRKTATAYPDPEYRDRLAGEPASRPAGRLSFSPTPTGVFSRGRRGGLLPGCHRISCEGRACQTQVRGIMQVRSNRNRLRAGFAQKTATHIMVLARIDRPAV